MASPPRKLEIDFVTLGMFIIDDIDFLPPAAPARDIIGGAGSYSAVGARILSPAPSASRRIAWLVDRGSDFPASAARVIDGWQTTCVFRDDSSRLTTRGWNGYNDLQQRAFKYLTPKLRLDHSSLPPALLFSKSFHLICSPARCIDLVSGILAARAAVATSSSSAAAAAEEEKEDDDHTRDSSGSDSSGDDPRRPTFVWEPVPDLCTPPQLAACLEALRLVDVVSPNHGELCGFYADVAPHQPDGAVARANVEACSARWLAAGLGPDRKGAVVVRCGAEGCYVAGPVGRRWLPAVHTDARRVADPTGGGNAFLGGFAVGLVRGAPEGGKAAEAHAAFERVCEAAIWGSVSASFAIEQIGMPVLSTDDSGRELWNGQDAFERMAQFRQRLA